jgi:hypothetical protein
MNEETLACVRLLRAAALGGLLLLSGGCERAVVSSDYFPLRDGNRWEYRLLDLPRLKALAAGREVATEPTISGAPDAGAAAASPPKAEVVGGTLLSREAGAVGAAGAPKAEVVDAPEIGEAAAAPARRVELVLKEAVDELTFRATYDGLEQVWSKRGGYVGFQDARGRHYLLILPPHTGYRWIATDEQGADQYFEIEGQLSVTTPAGVFSQCAEVRQESRDRKEAFRYWFAPGVGLVRRSKYFLGEEVFRQELLNWEARPARSEMRLAEEREIQAALQGQQRGAEHRRLKGPRLPP